MRTILAVLIILAVVAFFFIPGVSSLGDVVKEKTGNAVVEKLPDEALLEEAREEVQKKWEDLKGLYANVLLARNRVREVEKENKELLEAKTEELKYMKKIQEILDKYSSSKVRVGSKEFDRTELEDNNRKRFQICMEIDKKVQSNEKPLIASQQLYKELSDSYDLAKDGLVKKWDNLEEKRILLQRLRAEEAAYEAISSLRNSSFALLSRANNVNQYYSDQLDRRIVEIESNVDMLKEASLPQVQQNQQTRLNMALEDEISGQNIDEQIKEYLSRGGKPVVSKGDLDQAVKSEIEAAPVEVKQ